MSRAQYFYCNLLIGLFLFTNVVYGDDIDNLEQCRKLAIEVQISAALETCKPLAEKGIAEAQYMLGEIYDNAPQDDNSDSTAFAWFLKAAKQGHLAAQNNVSFKYRYAEGVEKNLQQAFFWASKAAGQGLVDAQFNLGSMYIKGLGTDKDLSKGFNWVKKAALQQHQFAEAYLGSLYLDGIGTAKDDKEAAHWFYRAAKQGHVLAQVEMGKLYDEGLGVEKDVDAAIRWFIQAALQGSTIAYAFVKDYAQRNNILAQTNMGLILVEGTGVRDYDEAYKWLSLAAKAGSAEAQYNLGVAYENGVGTAIDVLKAKAWYTKSAAQGFEPAQIKLKSFK